MAAYAALLSLMRLIDDIENHHSPPISLDKHQIQSLTENVTFLQQFLQAYRSPVSDSDEADPLEMRIADAAYAAEDVIESHIVDKIQHNRPEATKLRRFFNWFRGSKDPRNVSSKHDDIDDEPAKLYEDVQNVIDEMDRIKAVAMETNTEKVVVLHDQPCRLVSSSTKKQSGGMMVFSDHVLHGIMEKLMSNESGRQVIPITGMGGIGKTALAQTVYSQKAINEHFDICAWATISEQYNKREILCELVSQATMKDKKQLSEKSAAELGLELHKYLFGRRFLIVMDDMWKIESWDEIQRFFPNNENHSRIMVTTRQSQLTPQLNNHYSHSMEFLDEASSWNLLSKTVFEEEPFPLDLQKVGKEIAHSCRGLPLSIVVVGGILKNMERTKKCWESIRNNLTSVVNLKNDQHCLRLLKMSYDHLPVYLKPCFLYMGVFEEDEEILISKLIKLWVSEGFLKPIDGNSLGTIGKGFIKDLIDRNLILVDKLGSTGNIKQVKVHDLVRDLCVNQSKKEGFYHVVGEPSPGGIKIHRRIVVRRKTSKKKVVNDLKYMLHARSIICEHGKVPRCRNFRLLRTIQVGRSRGFQYVNLRHLAHMGSSFSYSNQLWNLQTLIVPWTPIFAFTEFWEMPQLRHIQMRFVLLPDPSSDSFVMENLVVLKGALNLKWDEEVVKRFPNIKKLDICYSGRQGMGCDDDYYLSNIKCLCKLESLGIWCRRDFRGNASLFKLTFPQTLKSLTLGINFAFEWETMMEKIGSLPLLEKFELHLGGFGTGKWEIFEGQFPCLKYLELDTCHGLKNWTGTADASSIFPRLQKLCLTRLEELENIPSEIGYIPTLQNITIWYCGDSVVKSAKEIVEEQMDLQGDDIPFHVKVTLPYEFSKNKGMNEAMRSLTGPNFEVV
ncbi:putative late blight resistance protein homolog R1B-16 [Salvia hispanica]|uniref:putative late blight resistance protein homolog R1B-16 n=1 Tax=Salvia hispanica TaxID=49212 RepID=UPI002008F852|nr:putative late blight resistance protein homolog R1B-16 [Salvia hispanica]